jgi:hypothetical protein
MIYQNLKPHLRCMLHVDEYIARMSENLVVNFHGYANQAKLTRAFALVFVSLNCFLLAACGPADADRHEVNQKNGLECLDKPCDGEVLPTFNPSKEAALKINGQWFVGPKKYYANGIPVASFEWWDHKVLDRNRPRPAEAQSLALQGKGYDFSVEIFFVPSNGFTQISDRNLVDLAEKNGWIESRRNIKRGLEAIKMKHVIGPDGYYIDHVEYYVATEIVGVDGRPPVTRCTEGAAGTGFDWKYGISIGSRMSSKLCEDAPEIYSEIIKIVEQLKKVN